jgi:MFS-type transporter involved in bile tolerance (Atg22 family)
MTLIAGISYHYSFYFIAILFYIAIYLIENVRNPIGVAYISELYDNKVLATALSANSQAKSLFAAILAPILGFLADKFGIGIALSALALIILISTPLYLVKIKTK